MPYALERALKALTNSLSRSLVPHFALESSGPPLAPVSCLPPLRHQLFFHASCVWIGTPVYSLCILLTFTGFRVNSRSSSSSHWSSRFAICAECHQRPLSIGDCARKLLRSVFRKIQKPCSPLRRLEHNRHPGYTIISTCTAHERYIPRQLWTSNNSRWGRALRAYDDFTMVPLGRGRKDRYVRKSLIRI